MRAMNKPILLLVDGSSYLYRAYHAMPDLRGPEGVSTGAIHGMVAMMKRLREQIPAEHAVCVFDAKGPTFRDAWYPEYKAQRSPMPDALREQITPIHEVVKLLGWPILEVPGIEADDAIGTLARVAAALGHAVVVSTGDKDLAQLVTPDVTLINTMSNEKLDEAGVVAKFGVPPDRIIDYLTLMGDVVDNVPGVAKLGPKTAAKWIAEFGSLDGVIAAAEQIKGAAGENLRKALDWLPMGRKLVTVVQDCDLHGHVPQWPTLDALALREVDLAGLEAFYKRYGFKSWLKELGGGRTPEGEIGDCSISTNKDVTRQRKLQIEAQKIIKKPVEKTTSQAWVEGLERGVSKGVCDGFKLILSEQLTHEVDAVGQTGGVAIYVLHDPRPGRIECYIGQTVTSTRFLEHIRDSLNRYSTASALKLDWMRGILMDGFYPSISIIESCSKDCANMLELKWIGAYEKSPAHILVNSLYDRALSVSLARDSKIPEVGGKCGFIAGIGFIEEIYANFRSEPIRDVFMKNKISGGYRLILNKKISSVTAEKYISAISLGSNGYWGSLFGEELWPLFENGILGIYESAAEVEPLRVKSPLFLSDYVPWHLSQSSDSRILEIFDSLEKRFYSNIDVH